MANKKELTEMMNNFQHQMQQAMQQSIQEMAKTLSQNLGEVNNTIQEMQQRLLAVEAAVHNKADEVKQALAPLQEEIKDLKRTTSHQQSQLELMHTRMEELEIRARRNNIVIKGLDTRSNETPMTLLEDVRNWISQILNMDARIAVKCFRTGKRGAANRPIVAELRSEDDKYDIFKKCSALYTRNKDYSITVNEDLPKSVQAKANDLARDVLRKQWPDKTIKVRRDRIYVDNVRYLPSAKKSNNSPMKVD